MALPSSSPLYAISYIWFCTRPRLNNRLHVHLFQIIKASKEGFEPRAAGCESHALPFELFKVGNLPFLGLANFFRSHVRNFATTSDSIVQWNAEIQTSSDFGQTSSGAIVFGFRKRLISDVRTINCTCSNVQNPNF